MYHCTSSQQSQCCYQNIKNINKKKLTSVPDISNAEITTFSNTIHAYVLTISYLNCQEVLSFGNAVKTDSTQSDAKLTSIVFGCLIRFYNYR